MFAHQIFFVKNNKTKKHLKIAWTLGFCVLIFLSCSKNDHSDTKTASTANVKSASKNRIYPDFHKRQANPNMSNLLDATGCRPLDIFFEAIADSSKMQKVRIAHYGDSQIEGDRISGAIRNEMQKSFGGKGIGYVPFTEDGYNKNFSRFAGVNWARYTVFHNRYKNKHYGYGATVFKFLKVLVDSLKNDTSIKIMTPELMDSVRYYYFDRGSFGIRYRQNSHYDEVYLLHGKCETAYTLNIYNSNNESIATTQIPVIPDFSLIKLPVPPNNATFKLEFLAKESPEYYGLFFDGKRGIQVDNLPIRGHSGDGLMLIDTLHLKQMLTQLNVKLVILQFGMNTVPYYRSDSACKKLKNWYFDLFQRFRTTVPDISLLVVGPGDMASQVAGGYSTYRFMPKINQAIKEAALEAGAAYFDVYQLMGGEKSVFKWKADNLVLYNGHFTDKGQELIGLELFKSLMIEYKEFVYLKTIKSQRHAD